MCSACVLTYLNGIFGDQSEQQWFSVLLLFCPDDKDFSSSSSFLKSSYSIRNLPELWSQSLLKLQNAKIMPCCMTDPTTSETAGPSQSENSVSLNTGLNCDWLIQVGECFITIYYLYIYTHIHTYIHDRCDMKGLDRRKSKCLWRSVHKDCRLCVAAIMLWWPWFYLFVQTVTRALRADGEHLLFKLKLCRQGVVTCCFFL